MSGHVYGRGTIGTTRYELDDWMKTLPQSWTVALEATIFTRWIYDHLLPHAAAVKVAHPVMRRAIAAAKKKNDRLDASKIADCPMISSLQRDPVLAERIQNLRTVPGVGPITALTWALEIGDVSRFHSVKQAISYGGLCGEEKSSADQVLRTPISKQRNKHIQHVLIEAAKLAARQSHKLALMYEKEKQKGNANRATLAVARKRVAYLLAVDREQRAFVPAEAPGSAAA